VYGATIHVQFVGNVVVGQMLAPKIQTQYPPLERLMMSGKTGVCPSIKPCVTVGTRRALPGGFRVIKAALDDVFGLTRRARDAIWPAQCADGLIPLHSIDQIRDIDLHHWTPVRGWDMGWGKLTPSSNLRPWNPTCATEFCNAI
jgi:hypothetical protein